MIVRVPAITNETRESLNARLDSMFKVEEEEGIQGVVSEVLNDKDLFAYLAANLPRNYGLRLDKISYWDDTRVEIRYGLAIDFSSTPKRTSLYTFDFFPDSSFPRLKNLKFIRSPPNVDYKLGPSGNPIPQRFADDVNFVLKAPEEHLIYLKQGEPVGLLFHISLY